MNSFTTKSKGTWGKADADLAKQVRGEYYEIGKDYADHTRKITLDRKQLKNLLTSGTILKLFVNNMRTDTVKIGLSN